MGNLRKIALSDQEQQFLESGLRESSSHAFRMRCQLVLLKSQGRSSLEVGKIVKMHQVSVNSWLTRYEKEGIAGLATRAGRGRKRVLDEKADQQLVRQLVTEERQRLEQAKLRLEQQTGKSFSLKTLKRFLKELTAATNASGK